MGRRGPRGSSSLQVEDSQPGIFNAAGPFKCAVTDLPKVTYPADIVPDLHYARDRPIDCENPTGAIPYEVEFKRPWSSKQRPRGKKHRTSLKACVRGARPLEIVFSS